MPRTTTTKAAKPVDVEPDATPTTPERRIILADDVHRRVPVDRSTRWRWERAGKFPKRVKLGSRVGYFSDELDRWLAEQDERRK